MGHVQKGVVNRRLQDCTVPRDATLRDVLVALDRSGVEIALVTDDDRRLVGIMTDGDVRRALLGGAALDGPVASFVQMRFTAVTQSAGRAEVIDLMQARTITQIPIVDGEGRLVGLHLLRDVIGTEARSSWAVVMAGGRGTRLAPLTDHTPKPMLRVAGRPILERIVLHLVGHGIRRIFISTNYLSQMIETHFEDGARFGARIEYLREEQPLGTAGALSLLPAPPTAPLLLMNGDLVTQADVGALLDFHAGGRHTISIAIRKYFHTVPFGCVELDGDRIVALDEKPTLSRLVNAGIYVLDPRVVARVPADRESTTPGLIEAAMAAGEEVRALEIEDDWIDVGHKEQFKRARGDET
jgi:dTDP-glucose pyrophosphorylase